MPRTLIYLGLGSNVGDRHAHLTAAISSIQASDIRVLRQSAIYETEPVDYANQDWFLNCAIEAETSLSPDRLLAELQRVERSRGVPKRIPKGPRALDIDILFYGSEIIRTPALEVPHPRLPDRRFVLIPLAELAPAFVHPNLGRTVADLLAHTSDRSQVRPWQG